MSGQTEDPAQDPQREQTPAAAEPDPNATAETPTAPEAAPPEPPAAAEAPAEAAAPAPVVEQAPAEAAAPAPVVEPAAAEAPAPAEPPRAAEPPVAPEAPVQAPAPDAPAAPVAGPPAPETPAPEAAPAAAEAPAAGADPTAQTGEYPWLRNSGGQHAQPRPYPPTVTRVPMAESMATPPDATPDAPAQEATAPMAADPGATATLPPQGSPDAAGAAAAMAAAAGPVGIAPAGPAESPAPRRAQRREPAELPELPPKPGFARHALGVLVGLVVTPIALVLTGAGVGGFRVLDAELAEPVEFDTTNFSLIAVGAALLIAVVMLALWSPAVPLTGGLLWGVGLGVLYLGWPTTVEGWIDQAYSTRPAALDQLVATMNDGTWLVLGLLLAAAGLAVSVARRMGRRFGEHTALATHARIEATRAEETRRRAAEAEEAARAERARSIT